ncbi:MAG: 5'-3' exonuclease H3TH domain-containing protein [Oscillospiraceae bacterium]|nr:5'-3' exonuclease H3TH domain-containing protein [Oscillospiraceae bacterium]
MDKLLIVDGSNLLFQMFFGMPSRIINKDGKAIQGTLGFVGALLKIVRMTNPTHLVVLFDGEHDNPRADLSEDYKANRPGFADAPDEENPFSQLPDIYAALDYMGILHTEIADGEADDAVASYALTYGGEMDVVISSFDSDFFQLINDNVSVLRYRGDKTVICDTNFLVGKFAITPDRYADFKSLTGDSSDNIKGAGKIGPKTAAALINKFGSLQAIIEKADKIEKPSIRESVKQCAERLALNYRLIKLTNNSAIPFNLNELTYSYNGITTNMVLEGIGLR